MLRVAIGLPWLESVRKLAPEILWRFANFVLQSQDFPIDGDSSPLQVCLAVWRTAFCAFRCLTSPELSHVPFKELQNLL
jgi:hypothetical protein